MNDGVILAVDPGMDKCGVAVLTSTDVLQRAVVPSKDLVSTVRSVLASHPIGVVVIGDRTGSALVRRLLTEQFPSLRVVQAEEAGTTLEARQLYFADHPPRGWRRVIPRSLQLPPHAYDDYAAIAVGRRYLRRESLQDASGKRYESSMEEQESPPG